MTNTINNNPNETLLRGAYICDLPVIKAALNNKADINYEDGAVLIKVIKGRGSDQDKIEVLQYLLSKGAVLQEENTLLTWALLEHSRKLVDFFLQLPLNKDEEELSLIQALRIHDCTTAAKLAEIGVQILPEMLELKKEMNEGVMPEYLNITALNMAREAQRVFAYSFEISKTISHASGPEVVAEIAHKYYQDIIGRGCESHTTVSPYHL